MAQNLVAAFNRWDAGCWNYPNQSLTGSEYMYGGIADYGQTHPCPNGLPVISTLPSESAWHRERVARARKFIEEHSLEIRVREAAEELRPKQIEEDIKEIKAWLTSLFTTAQSATGSRELNRVAAS